MRCWEAKEIEMDSVLREAPESVNKHTIFISVCQLEWADDRSNTIFENSESLTNNILHTYRNKQTNKRKRHYPFPGGSGTL